MANKKDLNKAKRFLIPFGMTLFLVDRSENAAHFRKNSPSFQFDYFQFLSPLCIFSIFNFQLNPRVKDSNEKPTATADRGLGMDSLTATKKRRYERFFVGGTPQKK